MEWAIETHALTKVFLQRKSAFLSFFRKSKPFFALDNVNLSVKKGEIFCLAGPNGSGKTTLIKILCSLILPTKGAALINGCDILNGDRRIKNTIGFVASDERSFYWRLTGRQNLMFFAALYNLTARLAAERIQKLIDFLEIESPDKRFQEYSTGIKQRLGIARSLLNDPQVLFMDEPTKSLDPNASVSLKDFIRDKLVRMEGKTVFFTTHNLYEAEKFSDRLAIINQGRIIACGSVLELKEIIGKPESNLENIFMELTKRQ